MSDTAEEFLAGTDLQQELDAIRARAEKAPKRRLTAPEIDDWRPVERVIKSQADVPRLLAAVEAVRSFCIAAAVDVNKYGEYAAGVNTALNGVTSKLHEHLGGDDE